MRFIYRLNVNDLKEANQAHSQQTWLIYYIFIFVIIVLSSVIPLLVQGDVSVNELLLSAIVPTLLFLALLYLVFYLVQNLAIKRAWKSQPGVQSEISVETTAEGLQINTEFAESKHKWPLYTHWKETANLFIVYQSNQVFNLFPKRAFNCEAEVNEFRELLRANLPKK